MSLELQFAAALQLLLAALLAMIIGLDRESHAPAGLRTHMLVGVGACLFTVLSLYAFVGSDPARVAAQVVVGIGFLGAGTILQRKGDIHHLTTAASIWATAHSPSPTTPASVWPNRGPSSGRAEACAPPSTIATSRPASR